MSTATPKSPKPAAAPPTGTAATRPANGFDDEEKEDGPWRHPPVAPVDEGAARSLGKAVSDVVTGPLDGADGKPKAP